MDNPKFLQQAFGIILFITLLAGCTSPTTTPVPSQTPYQLPSTEEKKRTATEPSATAPGTPEDYITFSIKAQDFAYPEQSADIMRNIIGLHEQYRIPVDIYLTSTMVDLYEEIAPDLLELLRSSEFVAVSYHVVPPKPYAKDYDWLNLSQESPAKQYETILAYETHGFDLRSGRPTDSPGGYRKLTKLMGYAPYSATTLNQDLIKIVHSVFADLGAKFTVVSGKSINLGEVQDGLYAKPEHVGLHLNEFVGQSVGDVIQAAFDKAHASTAVHAPYFVGINMQDNDFFASQPAFTTVYLMGKRKPPWDINRKAELLSSGDQQSIWTLYESMVAYVASPPMGLTPVNAPIVLSLEERANVGASPSSHTTETPTASTSNIGERLRWTSGTLYVTFISHNEEPSNRRPDYLRDVDFYRENRKLIVQLVEMFSTHNVAYNFQSDWNFLQAVAKHDIAEVTSDTQGLNLLRWMAETQGVEIDPHAHESQYNYADVAYLIQQLGIPPSNTVGGFLYDPPDNPQGWEKHRSGLEGEIYPSYFWRAEILWGASTSLHQGADDHTSGAWIPLDRFNFYEHDPSQSLLYLGGCTSDTKGVLALLDEIQNNEAPPDGFFTASIVLGQDFLTEDSLRELETFIIQLEPQVQRGALQWAHLSEIASMWWDDYQAKPFQDSCAK